MCYRPRADVDVRHCMKLQQCHRENRVSNHWGDKIFSSDSSSRRRRGPDKDKTIAQYLDAPERVYRDHPELLQPLTDEVKVLLGM